MPRAAQPAQPAQRALVVLGFETEVALAHDDDFRVVEAWAAADAFYVPRDEHELLCWDLRRVSVVERSTMWSKSDRSRGVVRAWGLFLFLGYVLQKRCLPT